MAEWSERAEEAKKRLQLLDSPDERVRRRAQSELDELCFPIVRGLVTYEHYEKVNRQIQASGIAESHRLAARSGGPNAKAYALAWLGLLKDPGDTDLIIAALRDDDVHVRRAAASALNLNREGRVVQPLIDAAEDDDEQTAHAAIRALGSTHNLAALPVLLRWRADPDWNRRVTAYSALGEIDDLESVAAAREGLRDRKPQVRKAAKFALGSIESRRRYKAKMGSK